MKRVVIISDMHCGNRAGITPPGWQMDDRAEDHTRAKFARLQRDTWAWLETEAKAMGRCDALIVNGDAIDGAGVRSGGSEQTSLMEMDQVKMAQRAIDLFDAKNHYFTHGTPYHVGINGQFEAALAESYDTHCHGHLFIQFNGLRFDVKHKVGSSSTPYGRNTASAKEDVWNLMWAETGGAPRADVFIRSHVHYLEWSGRMVRGVRKLRVTTPALQTFGTNYGVMQCSGLVDIGFISFDIIDQRNWTWNQHTFNVQEIGPLMIEG